MRRTILFLAFVAVLALGTGPASGSTGTSVAFTAQFLFPGGPGTQADLVVTSDPGGVLCPAAFSVDPADEVLPTTTPGPQPRGSSETFVGTAIRVFHCQGEGWSEADTFVIRELVKGNNDGLTADGSWNIAGGSGRLAGLHGGGHALETLAFFPLVTEYFTGTVHIDPS